MSRQKEIYQELQSLSDPKYKEFHGGLVPGEENPPSLVPEYGRSLAWI